MVKKIDPNFLHDSYIYLDSRAGDLEQNFNNAPIYDEFRRSWNATNSVKEKEAILGDFWRKFLIDKCDLPTQYAEYNNCKELIFDEENLLDQISDSMVKDKIPIKDFPNIEGSIFLLSKKIHAKVDREVKNKKFDLNMLIYSVIIGAVVGLVVGLGSNILYDWLKPTLYMWNILSSSTICLV
jgi:hypothetical protein